MIFNEKNSYQVGELQYFDRILYFALRFFPSILIVLAIPLVSLHNVKE